MWRVSSSCRSRETSHSLTLVLCFRRSPNQFLRQIRHRGAGILAILSPLGYLRLAAAAVLFLALFPTPLQDSSRPTMTSFLTLRPRLLPTGARGSVLKFDFARSVLQQFCRTSGQPCLVSG